MSYRRYIIKIIPKSDVTLPDNLLKELGCSITEPSNWSEGLTLERGLTFLDKDGRELTSEVFTHIPVFSKTSKTSEKKEIEEMICKRIKDTLGIDVSNINVRVSEY